MFLLLTHDKFTAGSIHSFADRCDQANVSDSQECPVFIFFQMMVIMVDGGKFQRPKLTIDPLDNLVDRGNHFATLQMRRRGCCHLYKDHSIVPLGVIWENRLRVGCYPLRIARTRSVNALQIWDDPVYPYR